MVCFCSAALLCLAVLRVSFFHCVLVLCCGYRKRRREPQEVQRKPRGGFKNVSKILPKSFQNPPKMAPGSLPGSLRRPLGAIWRRRWLPGALRGPSEGVPGASWVALGASGGAPGVLWRLLGRSGGVPGTLLGVILASLGCFLQGRLKNDPRSLKSQQKK